MSDSENNRTADDRKERLAQELRANLKRRKAKSRSKDVSGDTIPEKPDKAGER